MDTAVAIVQAYLHLCGYFTATEYPVIESVRHGGYRMATDLDVLAVRFPNARRVVAGVSRRGAASDASAPEPILAVVPDRVDMIIGEVKEGQAELNRAARDPRVLRTVLTRFGCCDESHAGNAVDELLRRGAADLAHGSAFGHNVRLVAFGSRRPDHLGYPCEVVLLGDVIESIQTYLREHWDLIHHAQFKDPALSLLMTLEKAAAAKGSPVASKQPE
ncbi:MAG TPA: hypothetical protein PK098_13525 [Phycisphaerales bacterium]|nr:hypothetical protein [Phycisphaerales bacterium]